MSARQFYLFIEEAIIEDTRKSRLDLAARSKFAEGGESIYESRMVVEDLINLHEPEEVEGMNVTFNDNSNKKLPEAVKEAYIKQELNEMIDVG